MSDERGADEIGRSQHAHPAAGDRWRDARRILCVRLDSLGDVLMCTPAMRALRHAAPGRHLTLLSSASGAAVAPCIPELDDALAFNVPWIKQPVMAGGTAMPGHIDATGNAWNAHTTGNARAPGNRAVATVPSLEQLAAELRRHAFDGAVIFTSYSQSALPAAMLCHQAGIPLRLAACRENPYALLTDWVTEPERERATRHEVQRQLDLVAAIGCAINTTNTASDARLSFTAPAAAVCSLDACLDSACIDTGKPFLVLHPGASAPSRRYPARHWPPLLRLLARMEYQLVLTGSREEAGAIDAMVAAAGIEARSLAGRLSLPQLGALLQRARLLVANNTGPAHIAAAVGTPVVSLYAMTNPQHTPWQVAQRVLFHPVDCRDCLRSTCPQAHHACLDLLTPDTIAAAVSSLLQETPQRPAYRNGAALAYGRPDAAGTPPLAPALMPPQPSQTPITPPVWPPSASAPASPAAPGG